jgi:hypothetical protein
VKNRIRLRVRTVGRHPEFPTEDDAFGERLWSLLTARIDKGPPRPSAVMARADVVHIVDLAPLVEEPRLAHQRVAGLCAVEGLESLALVGALFRRRRSGPVERFAVVFVEWPDGRWWLKQQRLGQDGRPVPGFDDEVQRAVDGVARPGGLGGWFSRARFEGMATSFEAADTEVVN